MSIYWLEHAHIRSLPFGWLRPAHELVWEYALTPSNIKNKSKCASWAHVKSESLTTCSMSWVRQNKWIWSFLDAICFIFVLVYCFVPFFLITQSRVAKSWIDRLQHAHITFFTICQIRNDQFDHLMTYLVSFPLLCPPFHSWRLDVQGLLNHEYARSLEKLQHEHELVTKYYWHLPTHFVQNLKGLFRPPYN